MTKKYRTISVSCKAFELLDKIKEQTGINKERFIEKTLEKEYAKIQKEGE